MADSDSNNVHLLKHVAISGTSGLIGGRLSEKLSAAGVQVTPLVRHKPSTGEQGIYWKPSAGEIDAASLAGVNAVVHLAGENIASRWTADKKRRIRDSRVMGTALLAETLAGLTPPPRVFVCASAVGYYGDRGDELLTEQSPPGEGFLADVCQEWEAAADPCREAGIRVAHLRSGVVLSSEGGALAKMLTPFKLGAGGRVGSGRQYMSWIALVDEVRAIEHILSHEGLAGPVNLVAPEPVTNAAFTAALGRALGRPTLLPVPKTALRLMLGEMADEMLLASVRAVPQRLEATGFRFEHALVEEALAAALDNPA